MTSRQTLHRVRIQPPFYSDDPYAGLHRYLDAEFISRFQQDVQRRRFDQPQFSAWLAEEAHSPHGNQPVLRLPAHRTFHVVCCEVVCEQTGSPALCPRRITSAGFVIRRVSKGEERAWMVEDGEPLGWEERPAGMHDPDVYRRLCANGVLHKRADEPAYSGEQTHPMHVLTTEGANGRTRTLVYGFVPLGGFYYRRAAQAHELFDETSRSEAADAAAQQLPWPFGYRRPFEKVWKEEFSLPVKRGRPSKEMFELLQLLINRYHLGERGLPDNRALERFAGALWFFGASMPADLRDLAGRDRHAKRLLGYRRESLGEYLRSCFANETDNPVVAWLTRQEAAIDEAGGLDHVSQFQKLPSADGQGRLQRTLFMEAADAQNLRQLLDQRLHDQTLGAVREIPLPKFGQGPGDTFQIVPFVRFLNDSGREQIVWADERSRSRRFRVAAPFDPKASRPSLIQMPSLADLKKGLAQGASMITPGDTFDMIRALDMKKGAAPDALPDPPPEGGLGIQWICSFSLPVITLVAMILLMIMISLLNILFFWMPWVRICLPFPKMKE